MSNTKIIKGSAKFNPITIQCDIDNYNLYTGLMDVYNDNKTLEELDEDKMVAIYQFLDDISMTLESKELSKLLKSPKKKV